MKYMTTQTVSLEVAKKLKEAGWKKHCNFLVYTSKEKNGSKIVCVEDKFALSAMALGDINHGGTGLWLPQLHEILEVLPDQITIFDKKRNGFDGRSHYWLFYKMNVDEEMNHTKHGLYHIDYSNALSRDTLEGSEFLDKNPHDAAALLWIWCVENGYIF